MVVDTLDFSLLDCLWMSYHSFVSFVFGRCYLVVCLYHSDLTSDIIQGVNPTMIRYGTEYHGKKYNQGL